MEKVTSSLIEVPQTCCGRGLFAEQFPKGKFYIVVMPASEIQRLVPDISITF